MSNYLSNHEYVKDFHNDLERQRHSEDALQMLLANGLDQRLAYHISTLFIRAPIPVYEKELMFPCCQNKCLQQGEKEGLLSTPPKVVEKKEGSQIDDEETQEQIELEFFEGLDEKD